MIISIIAAILLGIAATLGAISDNGSFYEAPRYIFGETIAGFAGLFFLISPLALAGIAVMLYQYKPFPYLVFLFLAAVTICVIQFLFVRPDAFALYHFAKFASPSLLVLSLSCITESATRQLKPHLLTSSLTLPVALAYWFITITILTHG